MKSAALTADYLTLRMNVERSARGRRPAYTEEIRVEISKSEIRMWDKPPGGELYVFRADDLISGVTEPLSAMPHLDEIYRRLAEQFTANRTNLVGAHLKPFIQAAELAIAARDGSSVYFAKAGEQIKIGWSKRVNSRLAQLQTGSATPIELIGTVPGGRVLERRLHERFAHLRLSGEWFLAAPELVEHIGNLMPPSPCGPN